MCASSPPPPTLPLWWPPPHHLPPQQLVKTFLKKKERGVCSGWGGINYLNSFGLNGSTFLILQCAMLVVRTASILANDSGPNPPNEAMWPISSGKLKNDVCWMKENVCTDGDEKLKYKTRILRNPIRGCLRCIVASIATRRSAVWELERCITSGVQHYIGQTTKCFDNQDDWDFVFHLPYGLNPDLYVERADITVTSNRGGFERVGPRHVQ